MCRAVLSLFSHVRLFETPWTVTLKAPLSMEHWSVLPRPPPGDLPDPGIEPVSLSSALASEFFTTRATWEAPTDLRSP